jgi:phosphatidylserine decarboxylase
MVHREGWPFVGAAAAVALLAFLLEWSGLGWLAVLATAAVAAFFRDPERSVPPGDDLLVAPADGLVCQIAEVSVPRQLVGADGLGEGRLTRISIFLSVFDVHVNRTPVAGTVRRIVYVPGLFLNASLDKASEDNERSYMVVEAFDGTRVGVVQIAGLVARRIVSFVHPGAMLAAGQRYGLIRFGSRTDLYVPDGWVVTARKGQRTIGGETVLARRP